MSIHINIVCDRGAHTGGAIGVRFESLTETFGDVVAALRQIGWHVETDGRSRYTRCFCPEHAAVAAWEDDPPDDCNAPESHPECCCVRPEQAPRDLSASELFDSLPDPVDALDH